MASIQKRTRASGKAFYVARVMVGGKQRSRSFDLRRDAVDWANEQANTKPTPGPRKDMLTVAKTLDPLIEQSDTVATRNVRQHLRDNLGELEFRRVSDVTADEVRAWISVLQDGRPWADGKPLSPGTRRTLLSTLSALFNSLVAEGHIVRNPCATVRRKGVTNRPVEPHEVLTVEQVRRLIKCASEPFVTMLELGATTGIRAGEISGLRVRSVDMDRRMLDITEQADGLREAWAWRDLKTERAQRSIPLPDSTVRLLGAHLEARGDVSAASPLFLNAGGGQWSTPHVGKVWRDVAKAAKVAGHSWHSLRHFYTSALIQSGASVTTVQNRLGHGSPTVTLTVYSHLWPGEDDRTRGVFNNLI